jgi:hypothetical protein
MTKATACCKLIAQFFSAQKTLREMFVLYVHMWWCSLLECRYYLNPKHLIGWANKKKTWKKEMAITSLLPCSQTWNVTTRNVTCSYCYKVTVHGFILSLQRINPCTQSKVICQYNSLWDNVAVKVHEAISYPSKFSWTWSHKSCNVWKVYYMMAGIPLGMEELCVWF